ncbi:MAG: ABC transporter substrate-binding protein [Tumebacillaceae bacterium]
MTWKKWALGASVTAIALTVTACNGGGSSQATKQTKEIRLTEVVRSAFYAPQYVALQQGYFKAEGLDVKLDTAWGGDKAMTRLLAGQDDIALIGAETTIYVQQQGSNDAVVSFAQVTQRDGTFLVARQKIDNFDWSKVKGKSLIGSRKGSMPEMLNEYLLKKQGITPNKDVQIIQNIQFGNQTTAFAAGTGDFYQAFEPDASILEKQGKGYVVASYGKDGDKLPYTVYMAKSSYLKSHPDEVQKFANAVEKGQEFVHAHSAEEVAGVIAPFFTDIDKDVLVNIVKRYKDIDAWPTDVTIDQPEFDHLKAIMKDAGELTSDVPFDTVVNTQFAKQAHGN